MQTLSRFSLLLCLMLTAGVTIGYLFGYKPAFQKVGNGFKPIVVQTSNKFKSNDASTEKRSANVATIQKYCKENNYDVTHCFMIDMSLPSGKNRFFIYNLKTDSVEDTGLVTHGSGSMGSTGKLNFSNVPGSGCTSLGKYKIGNAYQGRFGLAYKLHGLDTSNNKAFERFVVLHAHSCVPEMEVYPLEICPSLGCPTVSPAFLRTIKYYLDNTTGPVLLSIYE